MPHTPGEWTVFTEEAYWPGIDTPKQSIIVFGEYGDSDLGVQGETKEEAYANARLIAAAPNLLESLIALANKIDSADQCDHKRASCEEVGCIGHEVAIARKAIAKAEGK